MYRMSIRWIDCIVCHGAEWANERCETAAGRKCEYRRAELGWIDCAAYRDVK